MILFGSSISPFVRKVLAFAAEKGIELESKPLGMGSDDPEFLAASPFRKIPALQDGDFHISDSSAIIHYLDALRPDPVLIPAAPQARARTIWYDGFADTILSTAAAPCSSPPGRAPLPEARWRSSPRADKAEREQLPASSIIWSRVAPDQAFSSATASRWPTRRGDQPFVNLGHIGVEVAPAPSAWPIWIASSARPKLQALGRSRNRRFLARALEAQRDETKTTPRRRWCAKGRRAVAYERRAPSPQPSPRWGEGQSPRPRPALGAAEDGDAAGDLERAVPVEAQHRLVRPPRIRVIDAPAGQSLRVRLEAGQDRQPITGRDLSAGSGLLTSLPFQFGSRCRIREILRTSSARSGRSSPSPCDPPPATRH
jgi:glutathione S-transferase